MNVWNMAIACALRWGVALIGFFLYWAWLILYEKKLHVQGVNQWTTLIRGCSYEEAGLWLDKSFCNDAWNELVLACSFV